jgi:hypothetical protein
MQFRSLSLATLLFAACAEPRPTPQHETPLGRSEESEQRRTITSTGGSSAAAPVTSVAPAGADELPPTNASAAASSAPDASAVPALAPSRKPIEMITAPDMAFLIDDSGSGLRESATSECQKNSKSDDPAELSACVAKAREKFLPDVLRFERSESGNVVLSVYKRGGSTLREVYVASVTLSDETGDAVKVTIHGREQGQRVLFKTGSGLVGVPNDYSLTIDDPKYGALVYNAKIGLVGQR